MMCYGISLQRLLHGLYLCLQQTKKAMATNECTSITGHFNGHADTMKQYTWHCPMQHVQGYNRSHWTPPSGNYSLRIAPAAARATSKQRTIKKYNYFAGRVDGHVDAPVRCCAHRLMEEVQSFTRSH